MNKFILILILFTIIGCNSNQSSLPIQEVVFDSKNELNYTSKIGNEFYLENNNLTIQNGKIIAYITNGNLVKYFEKEITINGKQTMQLEFENLNLNEFRERVEKL